MAYIFGGDTQETPDSIKRKRAMLQAIAARNSRMPQNVGEGLNSVGQALLYRKMQGDIESGEQAGIESANNAFASLFGPSGGGMGEPVPAPGGGGMGDPAGASSAGFTGDRQEFIKSMMPAAEEASKRTGIDPRIIVAQAAVESGWGKSAPGNNMFGIKSHGKPGGQTFTTHEVVDGKRVKTQDSFRAYESPDASVAGYADFMLENPRYQPMMKAQGLDDQIKALGASGYATDPEYASKVGSVARSLPGGAGGGDYASKFSNILGGGGGGKPQRGAAPAASGVDPRIAQVLSNRFATPGQKAIASALLQKQLNPPQRQMVKGADGMNYYADTGERVLPNVQPPAPKPVTVGAGSSLVHPQTGEVIYQGAPKSDLRVINDRLIKVENGQAMDITPQTEGGGAAGMFSGSSVNAQALNRLVEQGHLSQDDAAQWAAGKTVTGPNGEIIFMTPQSAFPGSSAQPAPAAPAPAPVQQQAASAPPQAMPPQAVAPAPPVQPPPEAMRAPPPPAPPTQDGMIAITDPKITEKDKNRKSQVEQSYLALDNELDRYEQLVNDHGVEVMPGAAKDSLNSVRQSIMLQLKELFNLGVLNGPDLELMEKMVYDPVVDVGKDGGLSNLPDQLYMSATGGAPGRAANSAQELRRMVQGIRDSVSGGQPAPQAAPKQGNQDNDPLGIR